MTADVRCRDADRFYDEFLNTELELPSSADAMAFHDGADDELLSKISVWCRGAK